MAGPNSRKRDRQDATHSKATKGPRPNKKQRKAHQYHSSSSDDDNNDNEQESFAAVNVMDSDNDSDNLDNAVVDNLEGSDQDSDSSDSGSEMDPAEAAAVIRKNKAKATAPASTTTTKRKAARDAPKDSEEDSSGGDDNDESRDDSDQDDEFDVDDDDEEGGAATGSASSGKKQSKRNDPSAFATSISKILSTKLSVSKQADPVLSRSIDAKKSAQEAVDTALEAKARRKLREQKKLASEKGRVKDVLVGATDLKTGDSVESTGEIQKTERRLRKVAHRGVIMLFRAVREAQERAVEAEKGARKEGMVGAQSRTEKVNEMSRQGFLDLIAGSGGKLKKGGLQEA